MRLPRIRPRRAIQLLQAHGFGMARSSGSHRVFRDASNRRYIVPFHSNQELSPKAVRELMDLLGLSPEDL